MLLKLLLTWVFSVSAYPTRNQYREEFTIRISSFKDNKSRTLMCITMKYPVMLALEIPLRTRTDGHVTVGRVAQRCEGGPLAAASAASPHPCTLCGAVGNAKPLARLPQEQGCPWF